MSIFKRKESLQDLPVTLKEETIYAIWPRLIPVLYNYLWYLEHLQLNPTPPSIPDLSTLPTSHTHQ